MLDGDYLLLIWQCVLLNKYQYYESIYLVSHFLIMFYPHPSL